MATYVTGIHNPTPSLPGRGDAHASSVPADGLSAFVPTSIVPYVGRSGNKASEYNSFFSFDVTGVPLGSVINGVNLQIWINTNPVGTGFVKVGFLQQDGVWNTKGFVKSATVTPRYTATAAFPPDGTAPPHATQNDSVTIEPGALFEDSFGQTALEAFNFSAWPAGTYVYFGDGPTTGWPMEVENIASLMTAQYSKIRNRDNQTHIALTLDSQTSNLAQNRFFWWSSDQATLPLNKPFFWVDYTLNPPTFDNAPSIVGEAGTPYTFDGTATPYSLGDQTEGNFLAVTYSGITLPSGASINTGTGAVAWTPSLAQIGTNSFQIRATNAGGQTVDLSWSVTVYAPDTTIRNCTFTEGVREGELEAGSREGVLPATSIREAEFEAELRRYIFRAGTREFEVE